MKPGDRETLIKILQIRYPERDDLKAFLRDDPALQKTLDDIAGANDDMRITRSKLVARAEAEEWLAQLIECLHAVSGPDLRGLLETIVLEPVVVPAQENGDFCFANDMPFVNRRILRGKLDLLRKQPGKRILIVRGNRRTGKSHARDHIFHLAERTGFRYVDIRLEDYVSPADELLASHLGNAIADQMKLKLPGNLVDPRASRWSVNFVNWLAGEIEARKGWWIIIDDFEPYKVEVPLAVYEFIEHLAKKMDGPLSVLRLVLISYDRELPSRLKPMIEQEDVPVIRDEDLFDYFIAFFRDHLPHRDPETIMPEVRGCAQRVRNSMTGSAELQLEQMRDALIDECGRLRREDS